MVSMTDDYATGHQCFRSSVAASGGTVTACNEIRCGSPGACSESSYCADSREKHAVACCSGRSKIGWTILDGCSVYGQRAGSRNGQCHESMTLAEATSYCSSLGRDPNPPSDGGQGGLFGRRRRRRTDAGDEQTSASSEYDTYGARLCSAQELEDGCTAGTSCPEIDSQLVWTSTT